MFIIRRLYNLIIRSLSRGRVPEEEEIEKPPMPFGSPAEKAGGADIEIVKDYSVTDKWHKGWSREMRDITEAVIHHTDGGGDIYTLKQWMLGGEFSSRYKKGKGLFHYVIDREGRIWEVGPLSRWWYHSCSGKHDRSTVGIELIHKSGPYTDKQYEALSRLLFDYLPPDVQFSLIVGHDYNYKKYSNDTKGCPGPDFRWERLEEEMKKRGLKFVPQAKEAYELIH